ncbi:MAG: alginate export family protein, partial [Planctomycetaceae bacterium]
MTSISLKSTGRVMAGLIALSACFARADEGRSEVTAAIPDSSVTTADEVGSADVDGTLVVAPIEPASVFRENVGSDAVCPPLGGRECKPAPAAPPLQPWKLLFFNNDFSYKQKLDAPYFSGQELKDVPVSLCDEEGSLSFGGELRYRYMNELNRLRPGGPGRGTYDLWRWRNYIDYHYSESLRGYVEMIDASIFDEDLPITAIDKNRWDLLNAFVDLRLVEFDDRSVFVRFGRQELLYGSQRLVSPLDWGNARRNFEGFKLFSPGQTWDIDVWSVHPLNTAAGNLPISKWDNAFDEPVDSRYFSGAFATYHGVQNLTNDFYWLWDRDSDLNNTGVDRSRQTVGTRWMQDFPVTDGCSAPSRIWHAEIEGGYQFGHEADRTVKAGFLTAGGGHTWKSTPWSPSLWVFYDWASGDSDPNDDEINTFDQIFPLNHYYIGWIDNLARQNISDVNARLTASPTKQLKLTAWMHWMDLANDNDFIYSVGGAPVGTRNVG